MKKKSKDNNSGKSTKDLPLRFRELVMDSRLPEPDMLLRSLEEEPVTSLKINRRKISPGMVDALGYGHLEPVEWCDSGFYISQRPKFTLNPLLHAGVFYVQEAASMIYEPIVRGLMPLLPEGPVLDLCAAPGGKTTSIINAIDTGRMVVANEFDPKRANILAENIQKWGYPHVMVTNSPTSAYASVGEAFALVGVDAPCSGEGMMRKEPMARTQWSEGLVAQCAALQRRILTDAVEALMPGGFLIYSTCTFNQLENEDNLKWLIDEFGLGAVTPPIDDNLHIPSRIAGENPALRFLPHLTKSEGLFVAVLTKPGNPSPKNREKIKKQISNKCRVLVDGIADSDYPRVDIDLETALKYLRHESIILPPDSPLGTVTVTFQGFPLGKVKNIGSRANNLYPKEWRIRNL